MKKNTISSKMTKYLEVDPLIEIRIADSAYSFFISEIPELKDKDVEDIIEHLEVTLALLSYGKLKKFFDKMEKFYNL